MSPKKKHRLDVHFKSNKNDWGTPQVFFDKCNELFGPFDTDAAATKKNAKCDTFISPKHNALKVEWGVCGDCVWVNPPYGRSVTGKWVEKAFYESLNGVKVCMLLPARTDTKYFHEYILGKAQIYFVKGRLKFEGAKDSAPFPSMIVLWGYGNPSVGQL